VQFSYVYNLINFCDEFKPSSKVAVTFSTRLVLNSLVDPWTISPCIGFMTDPQNQEAYRKTLQDSLEEIEDYLTKTEESAVAVSPDKSLGRLSRMEAMQDQQLILEARRRKKMQKVAVLSALQRIENGQFGICIFCGKPIAPERLDVAPESSTCVSCS
jgi:DnaK suppressor protein